ncbi:filamentous hemagglutinin N-terminal domain-containing protein, partial [Halomonas sp. DP8Y7-3]|uniref:two-partner secretion domain-containing protein n=1 Tax=Halomonas sp. DP8Y7-3 TaxID=2859079 RepID=UPI001C96FAA2
MNPRRPLFRHLAIVMINALFWHPVVVLADGIVVAPGGNTRLDQAGNGVPVVNIATPNDKGLSHNRFRDYSVDARGLILNNATGKTQSTQLGGIVVGNANLRGQAAQVILNEVNGGNPSRLAGYTEVAGQAAKVVVANPYGISCDGCGFINSPRVTLTTGAPVIEDGRLDHYAVDQGQVAIEGLGLDAREVDQFEILTRAAALNAELHAQDLTIVAGANDVDAASLNATPRSGTGSRPALAIDSSALGGMYAERIRLVGTDAGVGVRLAGDMAASAGDIRITADGQLRLADASTPARLITQSSDAGFGGDVHADQGADIQADNALDISGRLTSGGDIALSAQRLTTTGDVVAGVRGGQRRAGAELAITAATLDNRGRLDASDRLAATSGMTHNRGQMLASELALTSRQSLDNGGEILADRVSLNATQLTNQGLVEGQRVVLTADVIDQQGRVQADHASLSATRIDNQGTLYAERLALSAPDLINRGDQATLSAGSALELETRRLANLGGSLVFAPGQDLRLDLERFDNQGGRVVLDGSLSGDIGQWNNAEGQLAAKDIALSAAWVDNRSGLISAETGALALASDGEIINTGGTLQARQGSLTLTAAELDNQGGKAVAAGALNVSLSESLNNADGRISAGQLAIVARHLDNQGGQVVADGDLTATLSGHLDNRDGGTLGAERVVLTTGQFDNRDGALLAGDVRIHSQTLDNARGMISADDALAMTVTQALANRQGQIQVVEGGLEARLGSLDNQQGTLVARRLSVASQGAVDNRQGQLVGDELRLDAGSLDNRQDGRLTASYLTLAIDDALDNQGGVLDADQGELQVAARRLDNRGGTLSAGQLELDLGLDPDQGIDNRDGGLLLADDLRLTAGSLSNTQGRVLGQSLVLTLAALYNAGGLISATQALGLALNGALDNQGGRLQVTDGQLQLSDATQVDNRQGVLVAQQLSLVDIGRLDNRQGQLVADGIRVAATTVDNTQQGLISAAETLDLTVQENLANASGTLEAARLNVAATRVDNTQGRLLADRIGLRATSLGNQGGAILAESDGAVITLTSQDARLDNADGVIDVADGTLAIVAAEGAIHNQAGSISADRLTLEAASLDNHGGQLAAVQGNAAIKADRLDNQAGLLAAQGGDLTLDIATVDNRAGRLQGDGVRLTGTSLDNRQGTLTAVERDLEVQLSGALDNGDGRMLANGVLGVDSAALTNLGGQLAGRGLSLTTGMLDNQQGLVESSAALSVDVDGLANGGGTLRSLSGQTTTLSARQRLDNRGGVIELGSRDARVNAADIDNRDGTLRHDGDGVVQLVAEQLANLNGRLQGTGGVSAELGRVEGVGQWQANGPLVLASEAALSVGSNERLSSAMALSLRAAGLINAGLVAANDRLTLTLDGALNNTGQLSSQGRLAVTATGLTQDGGRIASAGDASFRLSGDVTNLGRLTSQGDMTLSAASLDNQGTLGSLGDLRLDSASITNAPDTLLFAGGDMTLHTQQLFNRYGDIYSRGDLTLARNSSLAKADRLENRSGTIEAEGDMTLRAGDILNTKDRIETEDVLLDRAVAGTGYVRKVYRTEHNGQGAGDGGYEEVVTLVSTTELFREYELTETLRTTIVEDSPAAGIQAGGDLRITADTLENLDSVIAANGDIRIDAASLINSGRGNALVTRTSQYGDAEAASCLETGSFLDCFRGGTIGGGRYSYRFRETDLTDSLAGWNASSGFSDSQELLPLPAGAPDLLSQAETRTILPGGAPAVISAGGRVSITATEQLHNGDIQEHTLAQLQGRLGDAATQGPVSTLSMTLGRDADQASAQGLNAPSRVDRSGASRDASLADIGATPSTAGGGLDGALDASVGAGFDAGGGIWVFDDAPFLRVDIAQTPSFRLPEGDYGLFVRAPEAQGRY